MGTIMIKRLLVVLSMLWASSANAQAVLAYSGLDHIGRIANLAPSVVATGLTDAVALSAVGNVSVIAANEAVFVPVTATATIGKAALAQAAGKIITGANVLGAAFTAYQVYQWYKDSGILTCAPPDFFCKPATAPIPANGNWGYQGFSVPYVYATGQAVCDYMAGPPMSRGASTFSYNPPPYTYPDTNEGRCTTGSGAVVAYPSSRDTASCGTNYTLSGGSCVYSGSLPAPTAGAYSPGDLQTAVTSPTLTPAKTKSLWDAIQADNAKFPILKNIDIVPTTTPLTWTAPPVAIPQTVTKTQTIPNADGSTSTETTRQSGTVTPTPKGSTIGDGGLQFPTSTVTTVTNVNNTTNATTVNTTNQNLAPPVASADFPTDYNRESTQQKIETDLNTDQAAPLPDQGQLGKDAVTKSATDLQTSRDGVTGGVDASKSNWFSWVWTPPVGTCSPFAGTVHGFAVSWDLCATIGNIRDVIGWLLALFGAIEIYGQLFKRAD
jgi:hypothetical protein